MSGGIDRRTLLAGGGVGIAAAAAGVTLSRLPAAASDPARTVSSALARRAAGVLDGLARHFYDPAGRAIRPTNGGGPRSGLVDYAAAPSLWQMECFENVLFNDWRYRDGAVSRQRLIDQWRYVRAAPAWPLPVLAGDGGLGVTIYTFDDAVWQATYLMHAHMATGDPLALGCMAECIARNTTRFLDPDAVHNPPVVFAAASANMPGVDYGHGRTPGGAFVGTPFRAGTHGSIYTLPGNSNYATYGKVGSAFEAGMGLCALYVHRHTGDPAYRAYALHAYALVKRYLRTPAPAADAARFRVTAASRKAEGLYECQFCLNRGGGTGQDRTAGFLERDQGFYGKPVRNLDSTYLGGALMMAVLAARLYWLTGDTAYRDEALSIARAIPSPQGYGRTVGERTLIANTRDPHSEGQWLLPFVAEVLTLPGAPAATRRAIVDTASYMLATQVTPDGYVTADWAGPELQPIAKTMRWDEDYARAPGALAGHVQIMTSSQSLAMIQAGAWLDAHGSSSDASP